MVESEIMPATQVQVTIWEDRVEVRNAPMEAVRAAAEIEYRDVEYSPQHGIQFDKRRLVVWERLPNGKTIRMPLGLLTRLEHELETRGIQMDCRGRGSFLAAASADLTWLEDETLSDEERAFVGDITRMPGGSIVVPKPSQIVQRAALMGAVFPMCRMLVVGSNRQAVDQLCREWPRHTDRPITSDPGRYRSMPRESRLLVVTTEMFDKTSPHEWDMLVFLDARAAVSKKGFENALRYSKQLRYCFVQEGAHLDDVQRFKLEAAFGPVIHQHQHEDGAVREVLVLQAEMPEAYLPIGARSLERKRTLWHSRSRNLAISKIAQAFSRRDKKPLWEHGLFLGQEDIFNGYDYNPKVAILVESLEHGRELARLTGWELSQVGSVDHGDKPIEPDFDTPDMCIMTQVYAHSSREHPDIVIQAAGTALSWDLNLGPHRTRDTDHPALIIVDCADAGDMQAHKEVKFRLASYPAHCRYTLLKENSTRAPDSHDRTPGKRLRTRTRNKPVGEASQDQSGVGMSPRRPPHTGTDKHLGKIPTIPHTSGEGEPM